MEQLFSRYGKSKFKLKKMNHLSYPFALSVTVIIKTGRIAIKTQTERASTDVEIYQALNYRTVKEFNRPLTLLFSNPLVQSFTKFNFSFATELIAVDYKSNPVKKIQTIQPKKGQGDFIQGFSEYSLVILAPKGFCKKNNIEEAKTLITIK